jgi:perosamine synthetase
MYTIKLKDPSKRETFFKGMTERGIGVSVHFDPPTHLQPYYLKNYPAKKGDLIVTEKVSNSIVTLPMYPGLGRRDLDLIIKAVKETVG